jgi:hypothetical protein
VQCRLGTPLELPEDYQRVQELGHDIRNKLHILNLWKELSLCDGQSSESESLSA